MSDRKDRRDATGEERLRQGKRLERLVREHWDDRRGIRGLSQELGVSRATVYSWFRGLTSPDMATLSRLARLLGSTPSELLASLEGAGPSPELDARIRMLATEAARDAVESRSETEDRTIRHAALPWQRPADPSAPLALASTRSLGHSDIAGAYERGEPRRLVEAIGQRDIAWCHADDPIGPVRDRLYAHDYSQMPVRDRDRWIGLLTLETVARWMAARAQRSLGFDDKTAVREVLPYAEDPHNFLVVGGEASVDVIHAAFNQAVEDGTPLMAILVTERGDPVGKLLGIVTPADLPGLRPGQAGRR